MKVVKCIISTLCLLLFSSPFYAQSIKTIPEEVYQNIPFPMEKVILPEFPDYRISIADLGAKSSSHILQTEIINKAIEQVHRHGGGTVVIPAGLWITGPIKLLSNVCLHAEKNALILFSSDHSLYKNNGEGKALSPISANNAVNIAITGEGIFDGNGNTWRMVKRSKMTESQWKGLLDKGGVVTDNGNLWYPNQELAQRDVRPNMIRLWECKNVLLQGVTFRNSPAWCVHPVHCQELTIHAISVINPWYSQNGDAIDIESCDRVFIYDCTIDAGDDAICIKSGKDEPGRKRGWPCQNVVARNNVVYHGHGGFVVGSEMSGGVNNIFIDNCTFVGTDVGIRFKSTRGRGGIVENIFCSRINMFEIANENILFDLYYGVRGANMFKEEPVSEATPIFRNINITDVKGIGGKRAMYFNGLPEMKIQHIMMKDISFTGSREGAIIRQSENIVMDNVHISPRQGKAISLQNVKDVVINGKKIEKVTQEIKEVE